MLIAASFFGLIIASFNAASRVGFPDSCAATVLRSPFVKAMIFSPSSTSRRVRTLTPHGHDGDAG